MSGGYVTPEGRDEGTGVKGEYVGPARRARRRGLPDFRDLVLLTSFFQEYVLST